MEITRNEARWEALQKAANGGNGLASALAACAVRGCGGKDMDILRDELRKACGVSPDRLSALEQYWCPAVAHGVSSLVGAAEAKEFYEILKLRIQSPYSTGLYRRSYHTQNFGEYVQPVTDLLTRLIADTCCSQSVEELLYCKTEYRYSDQYCFAREICKGSSKVISLIREAILGDNSRITLSRSMIEAVIISGQEELLGDLLKLLTAAKLQEGLRQQILESADAGSIKVPPIVFSEVMRDIDLVVSVAHTGGVDPEASLSTVEMRVAIARELVQLLGLKNVSWLGAHAKIQGKLCAYSVHMGSGVVHGEGRGMIAILPVHSQARGRIFLPFADDDPKTAEIISKIMLLAEDSKIKDPMILNQICG